MIDLDIDELAKQLESAAANLRAIRIAFDEDTDALAVSHHDVDWAETPLRDAETRLERLADKITCECIDAAALASIALDRVAQVKGREK